ncbi:hypothetical protein ACFY0A_37045 [Streptomyces sp. NPDC001698]|uniref:hypothetical protein n=1 Tax=unclassified Streptomyces TaxID=2593676 RepID=UPI0036B7A9C6
MDESMQGREGQSHQPDQGLLAGGPQRYPLVAMLVAALILIGFGVVIGRMTADNDASQATGCTEVSKAAASDQATIAEKEPERETDSKAQAVWLDTQRHLATAIVQNPECFSAANRATAQIALDALKQNEDQQALRNAVDADCPWWKRC